MERRQTGRDLGLTLRMAVVAAVLLLLYGALLTGAVAFTVADYDDDVRSWFVLPTVVVCIVAFFLTADQFVLAAAKARVAKESHPHLRALIARLAAQADVPSPKLAVAKSGVPNSFAVGVRRRNATIVITEGLLEGLEPREIEAVLAHELTH